MSGQVKGEKIYRGIPVSAGVCRGKVLVLHQARHVIARRDMAVADVDGEVTRFEESLVRTRQQTIEHQRRVVENTSAYTGDIFDPHLLMLEDRVVIDEVIRMIRQQKANADFAFHTVTDRYLAAMAKEKDEFFRERVDV